MDFLVEQEKYLEAGIHIGTKIRNGSMRKYIYKIREDGLNVLDLKAVDNKLRAAVNMLCQFPEEEVFIIGNKENAEYSIKKFCELTNFKSITGRFTPGIFTNPARDDFREPKLILVSDPLADKQAVKEAFVTNVPVIALCDTNNSAKYIDLVIPTNNKGRKALAFIFWLLAREVLKKKKKILRDENFKLTPEDFMEKI